MLTILAALALAQSAPTQSEDVAAACHHMGNIAENIMRDRQDGLAIEAVIAKIKPKPEWVYSLMLEMARQAYETEVQTYPIERARQIARFRAGWEQACIEGLTSKPL